MAPSLSSLSLSPYVSFRSPGQHSACHSNISISELDDYLFGDRTPPQINKEPAPAFMERDFRNYSTSPTVDELFMPLQNRQFIQQLAVTELSSSTSNNWPASMEPPPHWNELGVSVPIAHDIIFHRIKNLLGRDTFTIVLRDHVENPDNILHHESGETNSHNMKLVPTDTTFFPIIKPTKTVSDLLSTQMKRTLKNGLYFRPLRRHIITYPPKNPGNPAILSQYLKNLETRGIIIKARRMKHKFVAHPFLIETQSKIRLIVNYKQLSRSLPKINMTLPFYGKPLLRFQTSHFIFGSMWTIWW